MISTNDQRIYLVPAVGSVTDLTLALNKLDDQNATVALNADIDYLYIGTSLPFNHRWFEIASANVSSATPKIEIWYANSWREVVDTLDRTESAGVPMAVSENLEFTPNRDFGWDIEQDSDDVTGLENAPLTYNKYWMRISYSANVSFDLKYVGQKYSDDEALYDQYPTFQSANLKLAWASGKTDWNDQHFVAADRLINDLISRRIIWDRNQVLDIATLRQPAIHMCAMVIFRGLGAQRNPEQLKDAALEYKKATSIKQWKTDQNANAQLDSAERKVSTIFLSR